MNYRQIIGEAWHFTQENKKLIVWYAFIPSFLGTIVGAGYLVYQFYAFKSSALFDNWSESFTFVALKTIFDVLRSNVGNIIPFVVAAIVIALLYFLLPPIANGAMIQLIARKKGGQEVLIQDGLKYGMFYFLTLFRFSLIARTFSIITILGGIGIVLRNFPLDLFNILLPLFIMLIVVSFVFMVLFIFSEYYIVIDDNQVSTSMAKSSVLAVKHFWKTFMISFLMFLIGIRILLQIIFVLLVPVGVMIGIYYFAASTVPDIGLLIGGLLGVAALIFASYLGAIVHVFTTTVWVFAFLDVTTAPEINARGDVVDPALMVNSEG